MGQKLEVQREDGFVAWTIEEVDAGVDGAVGGLEGELDVGLVVEVVPMTTASCTRPY